MAPEFRLRGKVAHGSCPNSDGVIGKQSGENGLHGFYWAMFDNKDLAISILDHPSILDIYLVACQGLWFGAANLFGQHDLKRSPKSW